MNFASGEFRHALGQFATGVVIVTARESNGAPIGMTVSSFNSVSLDPPLVLFSVARKAYSLDALSNATAIGINVLGRHQQELASRFARPLEDKWSGVSYDCVQTKAPLLKDSLTHMECVPYAQYDGGDHVIFVLRVVTFSSSAAADPLLFFRGKFQKLEAEEKQDFPFPYEWPLPIHY